MVKTAWIAYIPYGRLRNKADARGPAHRIWTRSRLMRTDVPMQVFTFFCVEPDGSVPRFDVTSCPDETAARRRAEELVGVHRGCDLVEVWRGATRLFDVTSRQAAA